MRDRAGLPSGRSETVSPVFEDLVFLGLPLEQAKKETVKCVSGCFEDPFTLDGLIRLL